jgi:truncated hemoglobin YjbI
MQKCSFYQRLRLDARLSHFFAHIEDFSAHEARIADFWFTAMGGRLASPPQVDMVGKHFPLGIGDADMDRWLQGSGMWQVARETTPTLTLPHEGGGNKPVPAPPMSGRE